MQFPNKIEAGSQKSEAGSTPLTTAKSRVGGALLASSLWLPASIGWLLASIPTQAQDAPTLIAQMKKAEATTSYSATQTGNGGTMRVFRSGLKRRMEWLAPEAKRGDVMVDDGTNVWLYHRAERSATQTTSRGRVPSFAAAGTAKAVTFAGRRAFQVEAGNHALTIDAQSKILLGVSGKNGGFALSDLRIAPVPASKFTFTAPAGVQVQHIDGALYANLGAAKRVARWLQAPATLPPGWSFESAIVGQNSAWLRYSNGPNRISLFEQPTSDADLAPESVNGGKFWRRSGARFLATGSPASARDAIVKELSR